VVSDIEERLAQIQEFLFEDCHYVPTLDREGPLGDIQIELKAVDRNKFDRTISADLVTIAYVSLNKSILNGLEELNYGDGQAHLLEKDFDFWNTAADILEIEARRIRTVLARAKLREPKQAEVAISQKLSG
jgi:hypothetical protein